MKKRVQHLKWIIFLDSSLLESICPGYISLYENAAVILASGMSCVFLWEAEVQVTCKLLVTFLFYNGLLRLQPPQQENNIVPGLNQALITTWIQI